MILEETEEIGELIKQIKGVAPVKKYTYLALMHMGNQIRIAILIYALLLTIIRLEKGI
jgi:hypothetical protein